MSCLQVLRDRLALFEPKTVKVLLVDDAQPLLRKRLVLQARLALGDLLQGLKVLRVLVASIRTSSTSLFTGGELPALPPSV